MSSLPENMRKSSERYWAAIVAYSIEPEASLRPHALGWAARRARFFSLMEQPVRPGML